MSVDNTIGSRLSEPFPKQVLGSLKKGSASLTYVPIAEVVTRLNAVLGVGGWSCTTIRAERDTLDPDWIIAHVRLTLIRDNGSVVSFDGHGGQSIKRTKEGKIVDLGDEFKGAESDALKKAASRLGVGLDLSRKEDALRYEADLEYAQLNKVGEESDLEEIQSKIDSLNPEPREAFKVWWKQQKLPKPAELPARFVAVVTEALDGYLAAQAAESGSGTKPDVETDEKDQPQPTGEDEATLLARAFDATEEN
jgi:hypothetical protein